MTYIGRLEQFGGANCEGFSPEFDDIRSIKRASADQVYIYYGSANQKLDVCVGRLNPKVEGNDAVDNVITFYPTARIVGASVTWLPAGSKVTVLAANLGEIVRRVPS